ncbi:MAG: glycosyl hydrolase-related protein [Treponema sp.]|jgi:alpha-mannosidase|nr:glycosyl hydrolase-related protein [Treponema sp.]
MVQKNMNYRQLGVLREFEKQESLNHNFYRIHGELRFLSALSDSLGGTYDDRIADAAGRLAADIKAGHCTTPQAVQRAEDALSSLAAEAKSFKHICVAHAHIDMNWMWGFNETVAVTLATMETMLHLMDEYPSFTFSQSQASVYRIVEEYAPGLFEQIRRRVQEGRWELLASTWVETDKNMPSGESLTRHLLYTKEYIAETFGIPRDDLVIDFEPDTFGHNRNVPEICASGGVKYYYHCRGQVGDKVAYRWQSPSGQELIVFTEPWWYIWNVDNTIAEYAPELARLTGTKTILRVYGVGDHGGGPSRRDINRLIEMDSWPLYPQFNFGRLKDYFEILEQGRDRLPLLRDEINFLCDGCYTTQTRIKAGNRKAERLLADAEFYAGAALFWAGEPYPGKLLAEAWRKTLFNQFHDIIPGSGVTETREYASGLYQQVFAAAESAGTLALEAIADRISVPGLYPADSGAEGLGESRGEGAGVGYGQTGRSAGKRRAYHVFNSLPYSREELVPITVWDYEGDIAQAAAGDHSGNTLPLQRGESGNYWAHHFDTLLVKVSVPPCGYTTVIVDEKPDYSQTISFANDMRVQNPDRFILENEFIRVELKSPDGSVASFIDKRTGAELAPRQGGFGVFRLAEEAHRKGVTSWNPGMSAWFTGRYKKIEDITRDIEIRPVSSGDLRNAFELTAPFGNGSKLTVTISLEAGSTLLRYDLSCDWREFGAADRGIPNLHFRLALDYKPDYLFDIPFGLTKRKATDMDLPAESFVLAGNPGGASSVALFSLDKYGFRCLDDSLALTLIRGAIDPDLSPETGRHRISFALAPVEGTAAAAELVKESLRYRRPLTVISGRNPSGRNPSARSPSGEHTRGGELPASASFCSLTGGVLSSVKQAERGGKRLVFRVVEVEGKGGRVEIGLPFAVASAWLTDATEEKHLEDCALSAAGGFAGRTTVSFTLPPYSVRAVMVEIRT